MCVWWDLCDGPTARKATLSRSIQQGSCVPQIHQFDVQKCLLLHLPTVSVCTLHCMVLYAQLHFCILH